MNCKHPFKGFILGIKDDGKFNIKITDYAVDHIEEFKDGSYHKCYDTFRSSLAYNIFQNYIEIPCGVCLGCRLDKAKIWKERCLAELKYHDCAVFLTLTYDDEHLPYNADEKGDEAVVYNSLRAKDLQDFWKRLRKNTGQKIRYFACGEYGSKTWRPHYHAIVYDLFLDDLEKIGENEYGQPLFTSKKLEKTWRNGFVVIGEATKESIEYVARYTCKKAYDKKRDKKIEELNIEPEFIRMSRRPAIGREWYNDNYKYIEHFGHAYIGDTKGSNYISRNPYYKKLTKYVDIEDMISEKKNNFKKIQQINEMRSSTTSKEYLDMLAAEEENLFSKSIAKKREL